MMKFDHLNLPVSNLEKSRDWYVALQGGEGFALGYLVRLWDERTMREK